MKVVIPTGWIIAGGILLLIILLLDVPVRVMFSYDGELYLKVKYLFLTLFSIPAKEKKKKRRKSADDGKKAEKTQEPPEKELKELAAEENKEADSESADDKADKKKDKPKKAKKQKNDKIPTLDEILALLRAFVDSFGKPFRKFLRRIKICDFTFQRVCGGEDAAKAALNFGRTNLLIGNLLGLCNSVFTVKRPHVDIGVDFQSEESQTSVSGTVKLSALAAIAFVLCFIGRIGWRVFRSGTIKDYIARLTGKSKKKKAKKKRAAKPQKETL